MISEEPESKTLGAESTSQPQLQLKEKDTKILYI